MKTKIRNRKRKRINLTILFIFSILISLSGSNFNNVAMLKNGCKMPFYASPYLNYSDNSYFSYSDKNNVNAYFLTDRFYIGSYIYSIGDFYIFIGLFLLLSYIIIFSYRYIFKPCFHLIAMAGGKHGRRRNLKLS